MVYKLLLQKELLNIQVMKAITILFLGMFLANSVLAQDNLSEKEQRKLAKKAKQDSIENADYQLTNFMVENRRFVLEANFMANRNGVRVPLIQL
jgi:hypothetical protein